LVVDEVHAHKNRELIDILTKGSGAARRQPLFVFITTAGTDRNSICWEKHEYALRVLKHRQPKNYDWVQGSPIDDPSFYAVVYGLRDDDDWTSEKNWRKANPSLGHILTIEEFKKSFAEAQANAAEENIFKQLRLNIWVKSSLRWMQMPHWDACGEPFDHEELKGKECYAGLDLAATTDLAALALVFPGDDYKVLMRYWIPEATAKEKEKRDHVPYQDWAAKGYITLTPGNVIDYAYIRHELRELREAYDIRELAFDRWGATKLIQDLAEDGFVHDPKERGPVIVPFGQGYVSMTAPTKELMNSVLTGKIRHGGHPVLRWNADNMVVRQDPAGNLKPDKEKATQKIDGVVALIMALDRAVRHSTEAKSVYESRGIITL
jgi:phage terminase large subunit-like protein